MASSAETGGFAAPVSDSKELELRSTAILQKTKSQTFWGIKVWSEWASARVQNAPLASNWVSPMTPLLQMPIQNFAFWLGKFVLEVRKQSRWEYPPKMLYSFVCCFKQHFEVAGVHDVNPLNPGSTVFGNFRSTLDAEMKRLHATGLGVTTKQTEPIQPDKEAILWFKAYLAFTLLKSSRTWFISTIAKFLDDGATMSTKTSSASSSARRWMRRVVSIGVCWRWEQGLQRRTVAHESRAKGYMEVWRHQRSRSLCCEYFRAISTLLAPGSWLFLLQTSPWWWLWDPTVRETASRP